MSYQLDKLIKPFKAEEIEWRVGSTNQDKTKGLALAYVTNRAIQNRLDEVFGVMNWQNEFKEWKGNSQICGISVWDAEKLQWVTKWDGADDSVTEAVKGGLSDSMKRAAYQWGIGRYLYNMPQTWVELKDKKYLKETPRIPKDLLPEGYKYPENQKPETKEKTLIEKLLEFITDNKISNQDSYLKFLNIIPTEPKTIPPAELWNENLTAYKMHMLEKAIAEKIKGNKEFQDQFKLVKSDLKNLTEFYNKVKGK